MCSDAVISRTSTRHLRNFANITANDNRTSHKIKLNFNSHCCLCQLEYSIPAPTNWFFYPIHVCIIKLLIVIVIVNYRDLL